MGEADGGSVGSCWSSRTAGDIRGALYWFSFDLATTGRR